MNTESNVDQQQADGIVEGFNTTDFDFAAYLMTPHPANANEAYAELAQLMPWQRADNAKQQRLHKFIFHMRPKGAVTVARLRELEMDYANRKASVEPMDYMTTRQQLRSVMDRHILQQQHLRNAANG